ncbi:MAG: DUF2971 domain-containing protein [Methylotenera sp.]
MVKEQKVPENFYYFTSLNNDERKKWFREIILENQLYFRQRNQLNDPNELRPSIIFEGSDKQIRNYVRNSIIKHSRIKFSPAERLLEENKQIYQLRNSPQSVEAIVHDILDRVGIFSLSEIPTEPLLWAHYADGHKGVVIEFDANSGLFQIAQKVTYANEAPVINRLIDTMDEILTKSMFTKNSYWSHEQEWRLIARWQDEARLNRYLSEKAIPAAVESFMRNLHGPGKYDFPASAVKSVIVGANVSTDTITWLNSVIEQASNPIKIRHAEIERNGAVKILN